VSVLTAGHKADGDWRTKPPMNLLDPLVLEEMSRVMGYGAQKYAKYNWMKGLAHGRVFAAAMRHMCAYWRGEDRDPETSIHHLAHALCSLMMLFGLVMRETGEDDRPTKGASANSEDAPSRTEPNDGTT
jgi:hypothetical protein